MSENISEMSKAETKELAYACFKDTKLLAKVLFPDRFFLPFSEKIHDPIFKIMDDNSIKRAVIAAPRGTGKTSIVNLVYPAKNILYRLRHYIVPISCSETSAIEQSENLKNELTGNPAIKTLFGNCKGGVWSKQGWFAEWFDSLGNLEFATKVLPRGAGQQVRGMLWGNYRPELLLVDDLEDPKHIDSDEQREIKKRWFFNDVMKSVHMWDKSAEWRILVLGTVLHENCLINELMDDPDWYGVRLEICDDDFKSNWPEVVSDKDIMDIFKSHERQFIVDSFYRELRNIAVPRGVGSFKTEYFKYYKEEELLLNNDRMVESAILVDPAKTSKIESDDSAIVGVAINTVKNTWYVRDIEHGHMFPDELINKSFSMATRLNTRIIGVEVTGIEDFIYYPFENENVRRSGNFEIIKLRAQRGRQRGEGKIQRIVGLLPFYRQGLVYHNKTCCLPLENQLLTFPKNSKWDIMDALSYFINLLEEGNRFMLPEIEENPEDIESEYREIEEITETTLKYEQLI